MFNDHALFVKKFEEGIAQQKDIKAAIMYHITSAPGLLFPVEALTQICHKKNIKVIIDGAHAFGHVDIDIKKIDPDFYMTNLHKWGYIPRPSALLYVKKSYQNDFQPIIIS